MKSIKHKGIEIEYSAEAVHGWAIQRRLARGGNDAFEAVDTILNGKADDIAELLGGSMDAMTELINAIAEAEGTDAKN